MQSKIYVISGKKRSGKDTVAKFIREIIGDHNTVTYALADPIKQALFVGFTKASIRNPLNREMITLQDIEGTTGFDRDNLDLKVSHYQLITSLRCAWEFIVTLKPSLGVYDKDVNHYIELYTEEHQEPWTIRRFMQTFGTDICVNANEMIWMKFMMDKYIDAYSDDRTFIITDCRQEHEMRFLRTLNSNFWFIVREKSLHDSHITEKGLQSSENDVIIHNDETLEDLKQSVELNLLLK